jgi:hypothetical protein
LEEKDRWLYLLDVAQALNETDEVLVPGPSTAKLDFSSTCTSTIVRSSRKSSESKRSTTLPTGQVIAYAKKYFNGERIQSR